MKNFIFLSLSYILALFFTGSFFFTMIYIFSFNVLTGIFITGFLLLCAYFLFTDTEESEALEVAEQTEVYELELAEA